MIELAVATFFLLFGAVLLAVVSGTLLGVVRTGVDLVATKEADLLPVLRALKVSPKDTFYDLGSGYGGVVYLVEKNFGAAAAGFESIFWLCVFCRLKSRLRRSRAKFFRGDFFKHNWSGATVLYAYLHPSVMARVEEKFYKECKPGSLAIIGAFPFPKTKPKLVFSTSGIRKFYVYQVERAY